MIRAEFFADAQGTLLGFSVSGHAGLAESGTERTLTEENLNIESIGLQHCSRLC